MAFSDLEERRAYQREWERRAKRHLQPQRKLRANEASKRWFRETVKGKAARGRARVKYAEKRRLHHIKTRSHLKQRYGLTVAAWEAMLILQAGRCAACSEPMTGRGPVVDHDHDTGKIRGLLCQHCNVAVGWLEGRSETLGHAEAYLSRHQTQGRVA